MTTVKNVGVLVPTMWGFSQIWEEVDGPVPLHPMRVDTVLPAVLTAPELVEVQEWVWWRTSTARRRTWGAWTALLAGLSLTVGLVALPWWGVVLVAPALCLTSSVVASWGVDGWSGKRLNRRTRLALGDAVELRVEHLVTARLPGDGSREDPQVTAMRLLARGMRKFEGCIESVGPLEGALAHQMLWAALDPSVPHRVSKIVVAAEYLARVASEAESNVSTHTLPSDT